MKYKVVFVHYVPNLGGAALSLSLLIKNLDRNRFIPYVLLTHPVLGDAWDFFNALNVPVEHIPVNLVWDKPWYHLTNISSQAWKSFCVDKNILKYLLRINPDIVHINDILPVSTGVTASSLGIPVVWHCRTVIRNKRPLLDTGQYIIKTILSNATRIIAISENEAVQFNNEKVKVIYNPVDLDKIATITGQDQATRDELGINDSEFVITAPIPLNTKKGAWDFLDACGLAKRLVRHKQFKFLIVGLIPSKGRRHLLRKWTGFIGPEAGLDKAWRKAKENQISEDLIITGFRKDIYQIIYASDLIVFPSHLRACGRQCFEAGAMGKPIIVTIPDNKTRVVLDGQTGFILPERNPNILGQTIAELAQNPVECKRLGQEGFKHVHNNFGAQKHALEVMALYDEILKQRGK
jgi:L-malate glycosyltransferase